MKPTLSLAHPLDTPSAPADAPSQKPESPEKSHLLGAKRKKTADRLAFDLVASTWDPKGENGDVSLGAELNPRNALEGMLITQLTGVHRAVTRSLCRQNQPAAQWPGSG